MNLEKIILILGIFVHNFICFKFQKNFFQWVGLKFGIEFGRIEFGSRFEI